MYRRFIPEHLLRTAHERPPLGGTEQHLAAALMVVDIVGYTAAMERYSQAGADGVERLALALRTVFERVEREALARSGDVLSFAGDAVLACWSADGRVTLGAATRQAAAAAFAVRAALKALGRESAGESLQVRIAVSAGDLSVFVVGGFENDWRFVAAGSAVTQAMHCLSVAVPSSVVCTTSAWRHLDGLVHGTPLDADHVRLESQPAPSPDHLSVSSMAPLATTISEGLRFFVPELMLKYLDAGQADWLAEFRHATTMFIGLRPRAALLTLPALQSAVREIQIVVRQYEGAVARVGCDDKGVSALCVWGVPGRLHEDDAARSRAVAMKLQAQLGHHGIDAGIGIAVGTVLCGLSGGSQRCEYTVSGATVNVAAHLMAMAQSETLCNVSLVSILGKDRGFEPLNRVLAKVADDQSSVWRVLRQRREEVSPFQVTRLPFIGRQAELRRFAEATDALRQGRGGVVVVDGPAGAGKSAFVGSALAALPSGVRVIATAAVAIEEHTVYFVWRRVLLALLKLGADDEPAAVRVALCDHCQGEPRLLERLSVLNDVLPLALDETSVTASMSELVRADTVAQLLVHLMRNAAAHESVVLAIEDVHWMDSASWTLAARVHTEVTRVLMVLSARAGAALNVSDPHGLLSGTDSVEIKIPALSRGETHLLMCHVLQASSIDAVLVDKVHARTDGLALFAQEMTRSLQESGRVMTHAGHAALYAADGEVLDMMLPASVEKVIASRFDRLPLSHQATLKVASVAGFEFALRLLADVHPGFVAHAELAQQLDEASALGLVRPGLGLGDSVYTFGHAITRDVVYDMLSPSQRRQLHADIGRWLEYSHASDLGAVYPLLAHHWSRSAGTAKALHYLEKAGAQSLGRHGYREAAGSFKQALTLMSSHPQTAGLPAQVACERMLGHACLGLGQLARARSHFEASFAISEKPVPNSRLHLVAGVLGQLAVQAAWRLVAHEPPVPSGPPLELEHNEAHAMLRLGIVAWHQSNSPMLIYTALRGLNAAEREGCTANLARFSAGMAIVVGAARMRWLASYYLRRSANIAARLEDPIAVAQVDLFSAIYGAGLGAWGDAMLRLEQAMPLFQECGDNRQLDECSVTAAYVQLHSGRLDRAEKLFSDCARRGQIRGDQQVAAWGLLGLARVCLLQGATDEASKWLTKAEPLVSDRHSAIELCGQRALVHLHRGAGLLSLQQALAGLALIRQSPPLSFSTLIGTASVAQVLLSLRERGTGGAHRASSAAEVRASLAAMAQFAGVFPVGQPLALLLQGQDLRQQGKMSKAMAHVREAFTAASAREMPYEMAAASAALARWGNDGAVDTATTDPVMLMPSALGGGG